MSRPAPVPRNRLLAALPEPEAQRVDAMLRWRPLRRGEVVARRGTTVDELLFVDAGIITLGLADPARSGDRPRPIAMAVIGAHQGVLGAHAVLGADLYLHDAVVDIDGEARALPWNEAGRAALRDCPTLATRIRERVLVNLAASAQVAMCALRHPALARYACWLLAASDATGSDELRVTQSIVAERLGVRRVTVVNIATQLRNAGAIAYARGWVRILDREVLEQLACACAREGRTLATRLVPASGRFDIGLRGERPGVGVYSGAPSALDGRQEVAENHPVHQLL